MDRHLSISIQNYLKNIYELTEGGESASTNALATKLNVKPASVTGMVQRLASAKPALVEYQKHQGVTLTKEGEKAALEVIRHHRLIEAWLVQTLGYSWEEVHDEAEQLEHVISEDFERRIAAAMGNPERDPHGEPIPSAKLIMPADESIPLLSMQPGQDAMVIRVRSQDPGLLRHLEELGLIPGARVRAIEVSPFDQVMRLQIQGRKEAFVLGPAITHQVFIEIL
jgi:DtxR family Mn-dependent transcriptional regulator